MSLNEDSEGFKVHLKSHRYNQKGMYIPKCIARVSVNSAT